MYANWPLVYSSYSVAPYSVDSTPYKLICKYLLFKFLLLYLSTGKLRRNC